MSKYANCHIKELSVKANKIPSIKANLYLDVTFYPRYVVIPLEGTPCETECIACVYPINENDIGGD